jgi:hypothetical protein
VGRAWIILGNPENRRVSLFTAALERKGASLLGVVSWQDLLTDPTALTRLPADSAWLRIESPGENTAVQRLLLARGHDPNHPGPTASEVAALPLPEGKLVHPVQAHRGLLTTLTELTQLLSMRPTWRPITPLAEIAALFDKRICHARYAAAGVAVAPALPPASTMDELLAHMRQADVDRVFVKLHCGSSASGLGVFRLQPTPRLMTTIRATATGWFNSLRVNRVTDSDQIRAILDPLLGMGAHVEQHIRTARLDGAFFDLRVLAIAGTPRFFVVRQSRHPITNLHLGGWRGSLEALRAACPAAVWEAAMADCRTVARLHGAHHLGIDVLFERGFTGHRVIEANAFGDLLPNLTVDGHGVYDWQIREAARVLT